MKKVYSDCAPEEKQLTSVLSSSSSSSTVEKVVSNDDLLTEILLRSPVRSLLRFKSVSKHWYCIITSPRFKLLRNPNPEPLSGIFVPTRIEAPDESFYHGLDKRVREYEFVPLEVQNPVKPPFRTLNFDSDVRRIEIEQSSNGLMLCSSWYLKPIRGRNRLVRKYYVYNPTINEYITLPLDKKLSYSGMTLAFDPSNSPHFMVVSICLLGWDSGRKEMNYQLQIYSSKTCTWKASCQLPAADYFEFEAGVYWNDAIHWKPERHGYDVQGLVYYFKFDKEEFRQILFPPEIQCNRSIQSCLIESRGRMFLIDDFHGVCRIPDCDHNCCTIPQVNIYELKSDYTGWSMKYNVNLSCLFTTDELVVADFRTLHLMWGEKEEESFLVVQKFQWNDHLGKAIRFNIVPKIFEKICDFPPSFKHVRSSGCPKFFQFQESLCGV